MAGILLLKGCAKLKVVKLYFATLGPPKRSASVKTLDDFRDSRPYEATCLRDLHLYHTNCDLLDLRILQREFPSLECIRVMQYQDLSQLEESGDEGDSVDSAQQEAHLQRLNELRSECAEDDSLSGLVSFVDL
eukprot:TRINITY_DN6024_c0_g2_i2.p2 TRINITY_DN6024_c0_g2~~TRINITY_DN6024_c0_g2_i2.p2  ORF type:complete len:133 (-),score=1.23 TRINITY_DN6024_c0_g2_i2:220-618(-)